MGSKNYVTKDRKETKKWPGLEFFLNKGLTRARSAS